jgi:hypothetical protein
MKTTPTNVDEGMPREGSGDASGSSSGMADGGQSSDIRL